MPIIDRIYYGVTNFYKAISLPTVSDYLSKKIPPRSWEIISAAETAITNSQDLKEILSRPKASEKKLTI